MIYKEILYNLLLGDDGYESIVHGKENLNCRRWICEDIFLILLFMFLDYGDNVTHRPFSVL